MAAKKKPFSWFRGRLGAGKTEYIILVFLIGIATIGIVGLFGDNIRGLYSGSDNALAGNEATPVATQEANCPGHIGLGDAVGGPCGSGQAGAGSSGSGSSGSGGSGSGSSGSSSSGTGSSSSAVSSGDSPGSETDIAEGKGTISYKKAWKSKEFGDEKKPEGEDSKKGKVKKSAMIEKDLVKESVSAWKVGDDDTFAKAGNAGVNSKVFAGNEDGNWVAGIENKAEVSAFEAQATKNLGKAGKVVGSTTVGKAEVYVNAKGSIGKEGAEVEVEAGGDATAVEVKGEWEKDFQIGKWKFSINLSLAASIAASAKGHIKGKIGKDGAKGSMGGKLALGPGVAFNLGLGVKKVGPKFND